jgi:DNA mismatch endonuclease (patch repair protein)
MSQIEGKNIKPEMLVRKFLRAQGFRYKKPDLVLPK